MGKPWTLEVKDLKRYPHFDPPISAEEGVALATNPHRVAAHAFYPFLLFSKRWNRFAPKGREGKPKERPIRYAARRDAYIFSRYRHCLSELYEDELRRLTLGDCVLAYRRIAASTGGKCNIHFASDAFRKIQELGDCFAVALDISSFFEFLDHERLYSLWCRLIGVGRLPKDHFRVFQAITKYAVVDKVGAYERLGYFGPKWQTSSGKIIGGYLRDYNDMPTQLCRGRDFQEKIAGGGPLKSIIRKNLKPYGVPQGAPISDLLANLYLLDFDQEMVGWAERTGGAYFRYSDDILFIGGGGDTEAFGMMDAACKLIRTFGPKLRIKRDKSSAIVFTRHEGAQRFRHIHGKQGRNGLEYLGFRFDGRYAYLRDSTLSNLYRKVTRAARRDAIACALRYPDKGFSHLKARFEYERLVTKFGRVEAFGEKQEEYRNWTFWTYARKASEVFGPMGKPILRQLSAHRRHIIAKADEQLARAVAKRGRPRDKVAIISLSSASV